MSPQSPLVTRGRWLRAGVFAAAMTVLAMTAHVLAGGQLPGRGVTVLAGLLVACLTFPVSGRSRGVLAVGAATVAAQAALHLAFALPMAALGAARSGTVAGHMAMPAGTSGVGVSQALAVFAADAPSPSMLAAHLLAAAALALGLRRGERALLDLTTSIRAFFSVLVALATGRLEPVVAGSNARVRRTFDLVETTGTLIAHDRWGRAPPARPVR